MILFRVDGNERIGLGHLMRCLSIASAYYKRGTESLFVTSDDGQNGLIASYGCKSYMLDCSKQRPLKTFATDEIKEILQIIELYDVKALFVDSYEADICYLETLLFECEHRQIPLIYIDDIMALPYPVDIVINYNIYAKKSDYNKLYKGRALPKLYLGSKYMPLRAEFHSRPNRRIDCKATRILVTMGGGDTEHIALNTVRMIRNHGEWKKYEFHVVLGTVCIDEKMVELEAKSCTNVIIHKNVNKMSDLMCESDVAVSASGTTLYELCFTQTPTVAYILADNQIMGAKEFEKCNLVICVGDIRDLGAERLAEKMLMAATDLARDYKARREYAQRMANLVDGKGAERIAETICVE